MPAIRPYPRSAPILALAGLALSGVLSIDSLPAQDGPPVALVVTAKVTSESIDESVELLGTVWPIIDSLVAAEIEGLVSARKVENGDRVVKGQALLHLDAARLNRDLEMAMASKAETEARLANASRQEGRARELFEKKILEARLLDQTITERMVQEGRLNQIEARIASIREDIERMVIRAPFSGVVTEIHIELGEWIARGATVVRLADLDTVEVRLDVPERHFPLLTRGAPAGVQLDALPSLKLDGRIFALVPQADPDSHTFPVRIRASNPGRKVGAGMLARVMLSLSKNTRAIMVPKDAIVRHAQQTMVYILEGDQVKLVPVSLGRTSGNLVEVDGEIAPDDMVVVRGNERLAPGMKVRVDEKLAGGS
jgi:RND family efflux transporter MFP subunit